MAGALPQNRRRVNRLFRVEINETCAVSDGACFVEGGESRRVVVPFLLTRLCSGRCGAHHRAPCYN